MIFLKRVVLILAVILLLTSCHAKELSCYRLFDSLTAVREGIEIYTYQSDLRDARFFSRLYYGEAQHDLPDAFSSCDDYCVALASGTNLWEVHIFHVISEYDIGDVKSMLLERRDRLQRADALSFYDDETAERVAAARVFTVGHYVVMILSDQNDLLERELRSLI